MAIVLTEKNILTRLMKWSNNFIFFLIFNIVVGLFVL